LSDFQGDNSFAAVGLGGTLAGADSPPGRPGIPVLVGNRADSCLVVAHPPVVDILLDKDHSSAVYIHPGMDTLDWRRDLKPAPYQVHLEKEASGIVRRGHSVLIALCLN
tara:strand:+ start:143 stop:469 length:327 start_codon:yes stop_codon:yes gene_type:complete